MSLNDVFFSISLFLQQHSRFTGQQGKKVAIFLTLLYHFHPLHRHLDISWTITVVRSPSDIDNIWTQTGNKTFRAQVTNH